MEQSCVVYRLSEKAGDGDGWRGGWVGGWWSGVSGLEGMGKARRVKGNIQFVLLARLYLRTSA